ncbi:MAG: hypothetical protein NXI32_31315 [bacterium]|nr:hypothetical protein [bacterium]
MAHKAKHKSVSPRANNQVANGGGRMARHGSEFTFVVARVDEHHPVAFAEERTKQWLSVYGHHQQSSPA